VAVPQDLDVTVEEILQGVSADGGELGVHILRAAFEVGDDD
jgi:hypothetical protein